MGDLSEFFVPDTKKSVSDSSSLTRRRWRCCECRGNDAGAEPGLFLAAMSPLFWRIRMAFSVSPLASSSAFYIAYRNAGFITEFLICSLVIMFLTFLTDSFHDFVDEERNAFMALSLAGIGQSISLKSNRRYASNPGIFYGALQRPRFFFSQVNDKQSFGQGNHWCQTAKVFQIIQFPSQKQLLFLVYLANSPGRWFSFQSFPLACGFH